MYNYLSYKVGNRIWMLLTYYRTAMATLRMCWPLFAFLFNSAQGSKSKALTAHHCLRFLTHKIVICHPKGSIPGLNTRKTTTWTQPHCRASTRVGTSVLLKNKSCTHKASNVSVKVHASNCSYYATLAVWTIFDEHKQQHCKWLGLVC